ncbi:MAG: hypothetical protein R3F11_26525 [Verrucomicrobiales bacterium]
MGEALRRRAKQGGAAVAATFDDPHRLAVTRARTPRRLLASFNHKALLLRRLGIRVSFGDPLTNRWREL